MVFSEFIFFKTLNELMKDDPSESLVFPTLLYRVHMLTLQYFEDN